MLRKLPVQSANDILGPLGAQNDLRTWGLLMEAAGPALNPPFERAREA